MNENQEQEQAGQATRTNFTIMQQNCNRSPAAQADVINNSGWIDIVLIQEPQLDYKGLTRASPRQTVIYPKRHRDEAKKTRSVILVNRSLNTDSWTEMDIDCPDVTGIELNGDFGTICIFNIYNDCKSNKSLDIVEKYLRKNRKQNYKAQPVHDIWAGDFNWHHQMWEPLSNTHLFTRANLKLAEKLVNMLAINEMEMTLPAGEATLRAFRTKNLTRPDNIFVSDELKESVVVCKVQPTKQPPHTDHFPIFTELELAPARIEIKEHYDYSLTFWPAFNIELKEKLKGIDKPKEFTNVEEMEEGIRVIQRVLEEVVETTVPTRKINPGRKRWWNPELKEMRKKMHTAARKAWRWNHDHLHPAHELLRNAKRDYKKAIEEAKKKTWESWLENEVSNTAALWAASRIAKGPAGDGGRTRLPDIRKKEADEPTGTYARTNTEKSEVFYREFFPEKPTTSHVPINFEYPPPSFPFTLPTNELVQQVMEDAKPNKVTREGTLHNNIMREAADQLAPYFAPIIRATFTLKHYPGQWNLSNSPVTRKPGKSDYRDPGAYRPINISHGIGRLANACVKEQIAYGVETNNLLPNHQYGARPGRTAIDAVMDLVMTVKEAWRTGRVASALFLDVKGAFPSVDLDMLWHEMRAIGIPIEFVEWLQRRMNNRRTTISFDDFTSVPFDIVNGLDQGCPGSVLYWIIYNSGLAKLVDPKKKERGITFVDDQTMIAIGSNFRETHETLENIMTRDGGALDWAETHNCTFGIDKFQLVDFTRRKAVEQGPPIDLGEHEVNPKRTAKLLGIWVDAELKWREQAANAIKKGQEWINGFRRLSKVSAGAATPAIRQLYTAIAIPKMLYGAEVFLIPQRMSRTKDGKRRREIPIHTIKKFSAIQRQAAQMISGAMRTTAGDISDFHAGILPIIDQIDKIRQRSATRLATLPPNHPLGKRIKKAEKYKIKKHRGPIEELIQLYKIKPSKTEKIKAIRYEPTWKSEIETEIKRKKQTAIEEEEGDKGEIKIYTDGSGYDGRVGAAAVVFRDGREVERRRKFIGRLERHEVYEGEVVGLMMGMDYLRGMVMDEKMEMATIYTDNQAAIMATRNRKPSPTHYLHDILHLIHKETIRKHPHLTVRLRWIPGHSNVKGNEAADEQAKLATLKDETPAATTHPKELPRILPWPKSAIAKTLRAQTKDRRQKEWKASPRYRKLKTIDAATSPKPFQNLIKGFSKTHTSILVHLRTGHIGLNKHLHRIQKADTPKCKNCAGTYDETVVHFLLHCPAYASQRSKMKSQILRATGTREITIRNLLTVRLHAPALIDFVKATNRLATTFPRIPELILPREETERRRRP